jgi:hypothetical protein
MGDEDKNRSLEGKCKRGETIIDEDLWLAAGFVNPLETATLPAAQEFGELMKWKSDFDVVAENYTTYCQGVKKLRDEASEALGKYQEMVSIVSRCVQAYKDTANSMYEHLDRFFVKTGHGNLLDDGGRLGATEVGKTGHGMAMTGKTGSQWKVEFNVAEHIFSSWTRDINPAEEGYYFEPYVGAAEEIANLKTKINAALLLLESNIRAAHDHISEDDRRMLSRESGTGDVDSATVERVVIHTAELSIRFLAGFNTIVRDTEQVTTVADSRRNFGDSEDEGRNRYTPYDPDAPGANFLYAYLSAGNLQHEETENYRVWVPSSEDPPQPNSGVWGHLWKNESPTDPDSEAASAVRFYDFSSDLGTVSAGAYTTGETISRDVTLTFTTQFYSTLYGYLDRLGAIFREIGAPQTSIAYLDTIKDYVETINPLARTLGQHIGCIIDAWVDFDRFSDDLQDELDDLNKALEKANEDADAGTIIGGSDHSSFGLLFEDISDLLEKKLDRDLEDFEAEAYRRNPEKLFYKEQCYLLTYIGVIAGHRVQRDTRGDMAQKYRRSRMEDFESKLGDGYIATVENGNSTLRTEAGARRIKIRSIDFDISHQNMGGYAKRLPYTTELLSGVGFKWDGNATLLMDGDPYAFLNKIAISKNLAPLLNINSEMLSVLQPYIRLFKVEIDPDLGTEKDIEISFEPAFTTFEQGLFTREEVRNSGTGLKSFQFTYDGSNPFGAKKSIKATLKLFSNSFDELMIKRPSPTNGTQYRYVDLAIKTFNKGEAKFKDIMRENEELAKLNFRLKAQVGYSLPKSAASYTTRTHKLALQNALRDSVVTLNLIPTVHDFAFDELGRVNFTINYLAYVEDTFSQTKFNVFSEPTFAANRIIRNLKMDFYVKECQPEAVNKIKQMHTITAQQDLAESISHLFDQMMIRDQIYYMPVSIDQIKKFVSYGPFAQDTIFKDPPQLLKSDDYEGLLRRSIDHSLKVYKQSFDADEDPFEEKEERVISASLAAMDPNTNILSFFYVSDLIDIILENIETELREIPKKISEAYDDLDYQSEVDREDVDKKIEEYKRYEKAFKKTRFLLGPVEFADHSNVANSIFVNLGDIPISVKYFFEWITSTMLDRDDTFYSLTNFMNDFFNRLVNDFLNNDRCFDYSVKQRTRLNQVTLLGSSYDKTLDRITKAYINNGRVRMNIDDAPIQAELPLIRTFGNVQNSAVSTITSAEENNFMIYFVGRTLPTEKMKGLRDEDEKLGVFHYQIGRDAGLVKDIKLTKTQTPGLQEVRFEQEGYDGLEQLRVVYDAQIETYANVNTFPGTYIYIDPAGYAPKTHPGTLDLTKYGVGGYYMIVKSEHMFAPGKADSTIEAKWVNKLYDPNDEVKEIIHKDAAGTQENKNSKCDERQNRAASAAGQEID